MCCRSMRTGLWIRCWISQEASFPQWLKPLPLQVTRDGLKPVPFKSDSLTPSSSNRLIAAFQEEGGGEPAIVGFGEDRWGRHGEGLFGDLGDFGGRELRDG